MGVHHMWEFESQIHTVNSIFKTQLQSTLQKRGEDVVYKSVMFHNFYFQHLVFKITYPRKLL